MAKPSITSTETFAARAQLSEERRVILWLLVLLGMLVITLSRRATGGMVMRDPRMFVPYTSSLLLGFVVQLGLLSKLHRANRAGVLLPQWVWRASAVFDLCIAGSLLVIGAFLSPRGAVPALSAPPLLLLPLVVLMSILRLRPWFTLYTGLAAAGLHLILAIRAIIVSDALVEAYPVYLAYGCILLMTAIIGCLVAREVKEHVKEAAQEASAHERVGRQVALMEYDLNVARDIQQGLLPPRPPELLGFDIAGMNRPADQTGGDYYDWQPLPDGRVAVVLADVTGHGIGPALVMAVCRAYARSTAPLVPDPAAMLTRLNELLCSDLPADRFITLVVAVLDPDGTVQLISAGHGPTLLYRASTSEVTEFGGDGVPLGVMPTEEYGPTTTLSMDEGDVLVLLTDGFFEWARPADQDPFGIPRLRSTLHAAATARAPDILHTLDHAVRDFCEGSSQQDDMTAVVIKRTAVAKRPVDGVGLRSGLQVADVDGWPARNRAASAAPNVPTI